MAFPTFISSVDSGSGSNATSHNPTITAVTAGEMQILHYAIGNQSSVSTPNGWMKLGEQNISTTHKSVVFWRIAANTAAQTTVNITVGTATTYAAVCQRISGANVLYGTSTSGSGTNANPASYTPPAGSADYMWIAVDACEDDTITVPSGYTSGGIRNTGPRCIHTAYKTSTAASEDPGAFTNQFSSPYATWTLAAVSYPGIVRLTDGTNTVTKTSGTTMSISSWTPPSGTNRVAVAICTARNASSISATLAGVSGTEIFSTTAGGARTAAFYWKNANVPTSSSTLTFTASGSDYAVGRVEVYDNVDQSFSTLTNSTQGVTSTTWLNYTITEAAIPDTSLLIEFIGRTRSFWTSGNMSGTPAVADGIGWRSLSSGTFDAGAGLYFMDSTIYADNGFRPVPSPNQLPWFYDRYTDWTATVGNTGDTLTGVRGYFALPVATASTPETISVDTASVSVTTQDADVILVQTIPVDAQSYAVTALDADVKENVTEPVDAASIAVTTEEAEINARDVVPADVAQVDTTPLDATINAREHLEIDTAFVAVTAFDPDIIEDEVIEVDSQSIAVTTEDANVVSDGTELIDTLAITVSTQDPDVYSADAVFVDLSSVTITAQDASVNEGNVIAIDTADVAVATFAASINEMSRVLAEIAEVSVSTLPIVIKGDEVIAVNAAALNISTLEMFLPVYLKNIVTEATYYKWVANENGAAVKTAVTITGEANYRPSGEWIRPNIEGVWYKN